MHIIKSIGNQELWSRRKMLFLTSKRAPFSCYKPVFKWVDSLTAENTVVCFDTSELEAEVVKTLLVNRIPTVLVVMDSYQDRFNIQVSQALNEDRMLIQVLCREEWDGRGTTPRLRNQFVMNHVDEVVCGYVSQFGTIALILDGQRKVTYLIDDNIIKYEDAVSNPSEWTAEDDKLLSDMYKKNMGIHAIHKATGRPYSMIYQRIKSLIRSGYSINGLE